jgi:hypothetical protein
MLVDPMCGAIQFDESNGNFFIRLAKGLVDDCSQLGYNVLTGKPIRQKPGLHPGRGHTTGPRRAA